MTSKTFKSDQHLVYTNLEKGRFKIIGQIHDELIVEPKAKPEVGHQNIGTIRVGIPFKGCRGGIQQMIASESELLNTVWDLRDQPKIQIKAFIALIGALGGSKSAIYFPYKGTPSFIVIYGSVKDVEIFSLSWKEMCGILSPLHGRFSLRHVTELIQYTATLEEIPKIKTGIELEFSVKHPCTCSIYPSGFNPDCPAECPDPRVTKNLYDTREREAKEAHEKLIAEVKAKTEYC